MTATDAQAALEAVSHALGESGRPLQADLGRPAKALAAGRQAVLAVPFCTDHVRFCASQRQQYSSWGWSTPSIDEELRGLDGEEREAILDCVRRALPPGLSASLEPTEGDLNYGVAKEARLRLSPTKPRRARRRAP